MHIKKNIYISRHSTIPANFFKHVFYILRFYYSTSTKEQPANILDISMVNHLLKQNPEMTCKELCKELSI